MLQNGRRLRYGCLLVCVVQSSVQPLQPPLSRSLVLFALSSLFGVSAMIKVVYACRWIFSLVVSRPCGHDQVSTCSFWVGRFGGAFSAFWL